MKSSRYDSNSNLRQNQYIHSHYKYTQDDQQITNHFAMISEPNGIYRCIMLTFPIIFAVLTIVLFSLILGYENSWDKTVKRDTLTAMHNLDTLMQAPLLKNFMPIASNKNCPKDYHQQSIGKFQGIYTKCVCKDGSTHSYAYCAFTTSCQYQSSVRAIIEYIWNGNKICVQKVDMNKVKHLAVGQKCEKGYKKCAFNICSKDDKCPMTRVYYTKDPKTNKQTLTIDNQSEPKGNQYGPIIGFATVQSKTKKPCLLSQYYNPETESKKNYPAFVAQLTGCGYFGSNNAMVKIESIPSATFESDNGLSLVFKNLQYYSTLMKSDTKNSYSLFSVSRPQFKREKQCEIGDHSNGVAISKHITEYVHYNIVFGVCILTLCCLIIMMGISIFAKISRTSRTMFTYQLLSIIAALLVITYMTIIWIYSYSTNISDHYNKFNKMNMADCFPSSYTKAAQQLLLLVNMYWDTIYYLGLANFIVACVFVVVDLSAAILREPEWMCSAVGVVEDQLIEY